MKLPRHKPEFCLLSGDTAPAYKIIIVDNILYVKKIELTPSVFNAINTVLNDKMHSTPLRELLLKYLQYQEDNKMQHINHAFLGEIPKHIAICMMDNDSYNRNYKKNPFNFQHYNLTQIGISVKSRSDPIQATETQL